MLYELLYPLSEHYFIFNVFQYLTFRAAGAAITSLLISFFIGPKIIRTLKFRQIGERIYNGPESHQKKEGTPTMGGIILLLSIILPAILWCKLDNEFFQLILFTTIFMGFIGFIDDYLKVIKSYNKGLIARYKLIGQFVCGSLLGFYLISINHFSFIVENGTKVSISNTAISLPFIANGVFDIGFFYIPLVIIIITASSNAINLTDGLDGLATGLVAISCLTFSAIAYATSRYDFSNYLNIVFVPKSEEIFVFALILVGSCIGFLWFNAYPAKIFMGDTGSLPIGAAIGCMAILFKKEILLIIIGGVFVLEAMSVIIQVCYYKITKYKTGKGKRFFKMAPLHHHFELLGWHENQVVVRFWIIGIICSIISLTSFKIQ